ncbi:MAG: 2-phospho-L-lactate guanylyltransferase [Rhodospirillaceae bacterium]|nr:2-phospho-L-lactate guanylyltransferase [Rhodospirillaceae bacterium]|tara:strand:+ start:2433 stop:3077 length:645 start_codon:yes stop_codon:yes gene_type:complete
MNYKGCLIIVPMKNLSTSKSRLEKYLPKNIKNKIVLKLFLNTISNIKKVTDNIAGNFNLAVLTNCKEISELTRKNNIQIIYDEIEGNLSYSIQSAAEWAVKKKYLSLCIFPADIAYLKTEEIKTLLLYSNKGRSAVICPSYDLGTNAFLVSPPNAIKFNFGYKSFLSHIELASNAGLKPVILNLDRIKNDVDNMNDVKKLFHDFPGFIKGYNYE